jgi:hypothetical protein
MNITQPIEFIYSEYLVVITPVQFRPAGNEEGDTILHYEAQWVQKRFEDLIHDFEQWQGQKAELEVLAENGYTVEDDELKTGHPMDELPIYGQIDGRNLSEFADIQVEEEHLICPFNMIHKACEQIDLYYA